MDISKFANTEKVRGKEDRIKKLAESADGEKIKSMVDGDRLKAAFEKGDTKTVQDTLKTVLATDEGARLLKQLEEMFK